MTNINFKWALLFTCFTHKFLRENLAKGLYLLTVGEFILPACEQYHINDLLKNVFKFIIVLRVMIDNHKMEKNLFWIEFGFIWKHKHVKV